MYLPNTGDNIQAIDAKTGDLIWDYQRPLRRVTGAARIATSRSTAISIIDTSMDNCGLCDRRANRQTRLGNPDPRSHQTGQRQFRPDHRQRQNHFGRGNASRARAMKDASSLRTTPKPARNSGAPARFPNPANRETRPGAAFPMEQRWHVGTWMVPSYDPELNLIYVGTSVTIPAPKFILGGNDNKHLYHNCTLAIDADTGKIVWYYQHIVDHWDLDHPFERILVDTAVAPSARDVLWINPKIKAGERRKVITGIPGKTGVVYTLDRKTGEFLWARPTVSQNVIKTIDGTPAP